MKKVNIPGLEKAIDFVIETFFRYTKPSPLYFKWISRFALISLILSFGPDIIKLVYPEYPIEWNPRLEAWMQIGGFIGTVISRLTVFQTSQVIAQQNGQTLIGVQPNLPLTKKEVEQKTADDPNTIVITEPIK